MDMKRLKITMWNLLTDSLEKPAKVNFKSFHVSSPQVSLIVFCGLQMLLFFLSLHASFLQTWVQILFKNRSNTLSVCLSLHGVPGGQCLHFSIGTIVTGKRNQAQMKYFKLFWKVFEPRTASVWLTVLCSQQEVENVETSEVSGEKVFSQTTQTLRQRYQALISALGPFSNGSSVLSQLPLENNLEIVVDLLLIFFLNW